LEKRSIFKLVGNKLIEIEYPMLQIKNARENNLKNISLEIPHNKLILLTGVSGSGKTSLAYDVIFKEGQGRFLESLSSNTRHYLSRVNRPDVDEIKGLRPVISVDQKTLIRSARSTVGTLSGIYDLLRLLFARMGEQTQEIAPLKQQRRLFSFNTQYGACPHCKGLGIEEVIDPNLIIKNPDLSLREGALVITQPSGYTVYSQVTIDVMNQVCQSEGFNVDIPWKDLSDEQKHIVWYGSDKIKIPFGKHSLESRMKWSGITAKPREEGYYKGIIPIMEEILKRDRNANILRFVKSQQCSHCHGQRLKPQALSIRFEGKSITDFNEMSIGELAAYFQGGEGRGRGTTTFLNIQKEILEITDLLTDLGLGYLQLNRESATLSGSESQRIRLANQIQNQLSGLLFVFDEPSIGMHSRDQQKLLKMMRRLVNNGNTVMVIEHEMDFIPAVDWIVDIGPKAGLEGGKLIFNGTSEDFLSQEIPNSLTKKLYLEENSKKIQIPKTQTSKTLRIKGADIHNLKQIEVDFQLGALNVVCGVSGSGKSSLVMDTLVEDFKKEQAQYISQGKEEIQQIIAIDQSPIGRTPRSNPATYTKVFDHIRKLFAKQETAKQKGFGKSDFSFNVKGGRCEACQGAGYRQLGMHFIGNVEIQCEHCGGKRFQKDLLEVKFQEKNIYEVLEMQINEACEFFKNEKDIYRILSSMQKLGLGYLQLGQRATTLSGGEAQRVKLATEMARKTKGKTLYILDEPTTGLHAFDVNILIESLNELQALGNSIIVIEHHHRILQQAHHIIELGPESGTQGGQVVYQGSYTNLLKQNTLTAQALQGKFTPKNVDNKTDKQLDYIELKGVRTHNLKNIDVAIPKNQITVITGVSGSGKSSLAFDTLFAEGQNQFLQSLPNYVRGRMNSNSQAQFNQINGLTPSIAVDGRKSNQSPRSTLGTASEIYDLLRLLYSRAGLDMEGKLCQLESSAFSFNNQDAACTHCKGLGEITTTDPEKIISNPELSILDGALKGSKTGKFYGDPNGQYVWTLKALDQKLHLNLDKAWNELSETAKEVVLFGKPDLQLDVNWKFVRKAKEGSHQFSTQWQGLVALVDEEYQRKHDDKRGDSMLPIMKQVECPHCNGNRLNETALSITIDNLNIAQLSNLSITQCINTIQNWEQSLSKEQLQISKDIRKELLSRLLGLVNMELEYLQINRKTSTLSGGEMQRLKIAGHIYGSMTGITYVLDEPSIGLHPKNTNKLLQELQRLKALGNTLVLVEHDIDLIKAADYLILMGPNAGVYGGEVLAAGKTKDVLQKFPMEDKALAKITKSQSDKNNTAIQITSAYTNNLKNIDLSIPTGKLIGISGVSGSGKSSLLYEVIYRSAQMQKPVNCENISGLKQFDEVVLVNQKLEDGSSLSIPLSYLGIFDDIRKLFAKAASTKEQKIHPKIFSFNTKEGRCPHCNGQGKTNVSMDFLSDISEICPECNGMRYHPDSLQHQLNGKTIAEVLQMTFTEAIDFFETQFSIFELINKIGLGYLQLGQSLNTLSAGEAQRLKLVKQMTGGLKSKSPKLFLLDEPSRGLNFKDIEKLFYLFEILIQDGHSIIMIEHNTDMLAACHRVIELGPSGGDAGGRVIC